MVEKPSIPGGFEIARLPRWAKVAFAARCARRVQPILTVACPDVPKTYIDAVEKVVSAAETTAASAAKGFVNDESITKGLDEAPWTLHIDADPATEAAERAIRDAHFAVMISTHAAEVEEAAGSLSRSGPAAYDSKAQLKDLEIQLGLTIYHVAQAAAFASPIVAAIRRDFEHLKTSAQSDKWTDKTAVPPQVFGQLWLEGEEPDWSEIKPASKNTKRSEELKKIPSEEDIVKLPCWARVAFAARCARRVQPIFAASWPQAPEKHVDTIENAISYAERSAAAANASEHFIYTVVNVASDAYKAKSYAAMFVADAAVNACSYAKEQGPYTGTMLTFTFSVASQAAGAAAKYGVNIHESIRRDFERLRESAMSQGWTKETPVPPDFFGPLWPEGEPPGWPGVPPEEKFVERGPMSIYFDRAEFTNNQIAEMISKLSELYRSVGGDGLVIKGTALLVPELEPVPEGV